MLGSQGFVCATRSVSSNRKTITRTPEKQEENEKKKGKSYSEKSRILSGLNIYNKHSVEWVPMKQVHELYSLRWQIEIVLKRGNHCLI